MSANHFPLWAMIEFYERMPRVPQQDAMKAMTAFMHWLGPVDMSAALRIPPRQLRRLERSYETQELASKIFNLGESQLIDYIQETKGAIYGHETETVKLLKQNAIRQLSKEIPANEI